MIARLGNVITLIGIGAFVAATAWWISFFYDLLGEDFQVARECFYWTTDLCALKETGAIFADVPVYDPMMLWLAGVLVATGVSMRLVGAR